MVDVTPLHNEKNILEVPSGFPFIAYILLTRTMKSRQNAILLSDGTHIFPSFQNIVKSVCTQLKGKRIRSKFRMVNLCNGGTKDFAELWEIIHLKI